MTTEGPASPQGSFELPPTAPQPAPELEPEPAPPPPSPPPEPSPAPPPTPVDPLSKFLHSRTLVVFSALFVVMVTVFSSGNRRESAARFIEEDIRDPVAEVAPFEVASYFLDTVRDCEGELFFRTCSAQFPHWIPRIPFAIVDTGGYVWDQGILASILVGLPVGLFFIGVLGGIKDGDTPWGLMLMPQMWGALVLFPAVFVWVVQLFILLLLLIVKETILAIGVLAALYWVYEKLELTQKLSAMLHEFFQAKPAT